MKHQHQPSLTRYQGRWVSTHWYNRYVSPIFKPWKRPPPLTEPRKRATQRAQEIAWLKQELDALVDKGELTRDYLGRYSIPLQLPHET